jgi:hypothetical protein
MGDWTSFPAIRDIVLFALAIYGAMLSTFNWLQASRKDRRSITLNMTTAIPTYDNGEMGDCFAKIEAVNTGHRVVTISMLTFELERGRRAFTMDRNTFPGIPDTRLPASLSDGGSAYVFFSYRQIAETLLRDGKRHQSKITPVCQDTVGNTYRGEPWTFDPAEFSRM